MRFDVMTLFPELINNIVSTSILGRAIQNEIISVYSHDIREHTLDKHRKVDDTPYGGGMGMVMSAAPIYNCFNSLYDKEKEDKPHLIYMSPKGKVLTQEKAKKLSKLPELVILCGHYEGVDQRIIDEIVDEAVNLYNDLKQKAAHPEGNKKAYYNGLTKAMFEKLDELSEKLSTVVAEA